MLVVFYVSGHGFGHASRDIEVMRALHARRPDLRIIVRTQAPAWLFDPADSVQPCETDTGVVQIDSLTLDEEATARHAERFYSTFDERVAAEASFLRASGAALVIGDVPPIAPAAAAMAGLPSVAIANFTWGRIYEIYPAFDRLAGRVLATIRAAYAQTTLALRLPFYCGFDPMPVVEDIPLIARHARTSREEARRRLGLDDSMPIVLASFGGHGFTLPLREIAGRNALTVLLSERLMAGDLPPGDRIRNLSQADLSARGLRYEDLVAAADAVVTKPGYGIASECIANRTAMLYTSRGHFAEYPVMEREMPRYIRCRFLAQEELLGARWTDPVLALLGQPPPPEQPRTTGAAAAADRILRFVS